MLTPEQLEQRLSAFDKVIKASFNAKGMEIESITLSLEEDESKTNYRVTIQVVAPYLAAGSNWIVGVIPAGAMNKFLELNIEGEPDASPEGEAMLKATIESFNWYLKAGFDFVGRMIHTTKILNGHRRNSTI